MENKELTEIDRQLVKTLAISLLWAYITPDKKNILILYVPGIVAFVYKDIEPQFFSSLASSEQPKSG
jgi:hypothetical protein